MRLETTNYHSEKMRKEARIKNVSLDAESEEKERKEVTSDEKMEKVLESKKVRPTIEEVKQGLDLTLVSTASFLISHCMRAVNELLSIKSFEEVIKTPEKTLMIKQDYWTIRSKLNSVINILDTVVANLPTKGGEQHGD